MLSFSRMTFLKRLCLSSLLTVGQSEFLHYEVFGENTWCWLVRCALRDRWLVSLIGRSSGQKSSSYMYGSKRGYLEGKEGKEMLFLHVNAFDIKESWRKHTGRHILLNRDFFGSWSHSPAPKLCGSSCHVMESIKAFCTGVLTCPYSIQLPSKVTSVLSNQTLSSSALLFIVPAARNIYSHSTITPCTYHALWATKTITFSLNKSPWASHLIMLIVLFSTCLW